MSGLTLDTGALIALERRERRAIALVRLARERGHRITVPTPVIAEWWRGQRGPVARVLEAFIVEPLGESLARVAGEALARVSAPGAVDAMVMASAASRGDWVLTTDIEDLDRLREVFPMVRLLGVNNRAAT